MQTRWIAFLKKLISKLESDNKSFNYGNLLKRAIPVALPLLLFLISATQCSSKTTQLQHTQSLLAQEQRKFNAVSDELLDLKEKYTNLDNEFKDYKSENEELILEGKIALQAKKDEEQYRAAEKLVIDIEKTLDKGKIESIKQEIEKLNDSTRRGALLDRLQKLSEKIKQNEENVKKVTEAEKVVKFLEDNQTIIS